MASQSNREAVIEGRRQEELLPKRRANTEKIKCKQNGHHEAAAGSRKWIVVKHIFY
jgi:hypothetical protein